MLRQHEEDRIYSAIPVEFEVPWNSTTYTYDVPKWWDEEEHELDYPKIILSWDVREGIREAQQPMNNLFEVDTSPDPDGVAIERETGHRLYDDMVIKCSTSGEVNDDGIPSKVRARELCHMVARFFRYEFDQNEEGENGERPVLADVIQAPTFSGDRIGGGKADSYQMSVRFSYTERHREEIDEIEDTEQETTME